ncbi:MAG: TetR family transcriptional regulator [Flavobacteriaceae bacterium]|nr:TetR family transcriptional regulator [Flavobacteriaceae bacterium]
MSKTLKHETKAEYLLDKGIEVLWCCGYNGTSINDIVKAADVPKGSFYFYFDSKEDFVVKALGRYFNKMFAGAKEILEDKNISAKQRLINTYEYRIRVLVEEMHCKLGCLANNIGNEMSEHSDKIRNTVLELENKVKESIVSVFKEAQENKEIESNFDAEKIVDFIEDAGKGAMITMKEKQSSIPLENTLLFIKELFLK